MVVRPSNRSTIWLPEQPAMISPEIRLLDMSEIDEKCNTEAAYAYSYWP